MEDHTEMSIIVATSSLTFAECNYDQIDIEGIN